MQTLVHMVVLIGVVVVMPLVFGGVRRWSFVGLAVLVSMLLPVGAGAAAVASVWLALAAWAALAEVRARSLRLVPAGFGVVAATAFVQSRAGITLFGIGEPIVELTAVHFTYAGVGAVTLAGAVAVGRLGRWALVATIAALPVVATGFVLSHPVAQVGGAVLLSVGVLLTASLQLRESVGGGAPGAAVDRPRRALLVLSGVAPWVPMGLAVAWAASLYADVPALSVPDMARTHGVMNVVFVVAGLVARRVDRAGSLASPPAASPIGVGGRS